MTWICRLTEKIWSTIDLSTGISMHMGFYNEKENQFKYSNIVNSYISFES